MHYKQIILEMLLQFHQKKAIGCKWVFKTKPKSNRCLEILKARLVIRGFTQRYGIDYQEVFSPVVKMAIIKTIVAVSVVKGWTMYQLDVNNALLHGELDAEVYMQMPKGIRNPDKQIEKVFVWPQVGQQT